MRIIYEETLEECCDIESIVMTKQRVEGRRNVATKAGKGSQKFVTTNLLEINSARQ